MSINVEFLLVNFFPASAGFFFGCAKESNGVSSSSSKESRKFWFPASQAGVFPEIFLPLKFFKEKLQIFQPPGLEKTTF